jgi:hypothetical protein
LLLIVGQSLKKWRIEMQHCNVAPRAKAMTESKTQAYFIAKTSIACIEFILKCVCVCFIKLKTLNIPGHFFICEILKSNDDNVNSRDPF